MGFRQFLIVQQYIVKNIDIGEEREFTNYKLAEDWLVEMRETRPTSRWVMFAELDR